MLVVAHAVTCCEKLITHLGIYGRIRIITNGDNVVSECALLIFFSLWVSHQLYLELVTGSLSFCLVFGSGELTLDWSSFTLSAVC